MSFCHFLLYIKELQKKLHLIYEWPENTKKFNLSLTKVEASLREKIRHYKSVASEIEKYLSEKPNEWGRFQIEFNKEVDNIFHAIMNFEKENYAGGYEEKRFA